MLKKSNRISLEEATRLAILGKLPLMESKEIKKESTTVSTSGDGLTTVETDDANIVIEPKDNAAVDVGCPVDTTPVPVEKPVETPTEDIPEDDEPIMMEGKQIKKTEVKSKKIEHKLSVTETRKRKKVETIDVTEHTYIDTFEELRDFCWGSAADSTLDEVERLGKEDELMDYLEEVTGGESGSTELNDIVAYDDFLPQELGLFDYADRDDEDLDESKKVEGKKIEEGDAQLFKKKINKTDIKKVESADVKKGDPRKKVISKHDIKKIESKKIEEGEAPLFKTKINKTDIKKVEGKDCKDCGKEQKIVEDKLEEKEPKKHVINKVNLKKEEAIKRIMEKKAETKKTDFNEKLKTKVAEGLTKFVKEAYTNGKEVKVEKVIRLTENKVYVKGSLVMENSTKDFSCKLVPVKENKSFRKYTILENKLLKITEGKTSRGKSFNLIIRK